MPPSPFRPGLAQLSHKRLERWLANVRVGGTHVAVVLAEAQQLAIDVRLIKLERALRIATPMRMRQRSPRAPVTI